MQSFDLLGDQVASGARLPGPTSSGSRTVGPQGGVRGLLPQALLIHVHIYIYILCMYNIYAGICSPQRPLDSLLLRQVALADLAQTGRTAAR